MNNNISKVCSTIFYLALFFTICFMLYQMVYILVIKQGVANLDKISVLTQEYQVSWIYMCPDYVSNYYKCPEQQKFMNLSGKYCNNTLVCENKYIISNRTK